MDELQQAIQKFSNPSNLEYFSKLLEDTNACMAKHAGDPTFDTDLCEPSIVSESNYYTFHTHPHDKPTPSGLDIQTSERLGKKLLCIGLPNEKKIICYDTSGQTVVGEWDL